MLLSPRALVRSRFGLFLFREFFSARGPVERMKPKTSSDLKIFPLLR